MSRNDEIITRIDRLEVLLTDLIRMVGQTNARLDGIEKKIDVIHMAGVSDRMRFESEIKALSEVTFRTAAKVEMIEEERQ